MHLLYVRIVRIICKKLVLVVGMVWCLTIDVARDGCASVPPGLDCPTNLLRK